MTLSLISVNRQDFNEAKSEGYVYGYAQYGTAKVPVYVDLGQEHEYRRTVRDDPCTIYRLFAHSTVYYAKTNHDLDNDEYSAVLKDQTVKIFC